MTNGLHLPTIAPALLLCLSISVCAKAELPDEPPITEDDREHWSFQPLVRPAVPATVRTDWSRNPVDAFILRKIETAGLEPMPEADRVTLIRRLTFDLTGLPPAPEEIDRFVADSAPDAYERLVNRLLASADYGERQAQHWLDLARFAETDGFEHDLVRPNAWRYRDWVIDAFNDDLPYDEFVRLQLAGDELRPGDQAAAVATGFLLCGPDMPDINLQEERRHVFLNDMTSTVGSVLLGLQVGCAQCHDHKYDPVSQADFYRLRAFFDPADIFNERPIPAPEEKVAYDAAVARRRAELKPLQAQLEELEAGVLERVRSDRNEPDLKLDRKELKPHFKDKEREEAERLESRIAEIEKQPLPKLPVGRVVGPRVAKPQPSRLMLRGDFRRPGPELEPAFLRVVNAAGESVAQPRSDGATAGYRTALAEWLTRPDHPLAARVIVNRVWQQHFGQGIVRTPSDFGVTGELPTHPELLDWLATELPRQGWSLKRLHRLLVTSATYRQASRPPSNERDAEQSDLFARIVERDPSNRLLARMSRRRLEGEAIRDALLVANGRLNRSRGGEGVRPPLPEELVSTLLKDQWPVTKNEADHRRRSVYLFVRRNLRYPLFEVFDRPDTNASCPRRNQSTIAPQALTLLNSELTLSAARDLAGRLIAEAGHEQAEQVRLCYRRLLGREPSSEERTLALDFLAASAEHLKAEGRDRPSLAIPPGLPDDYDIHDAAALTDLCLALCNLNEFVYID